MRVSFGVLALLLSAMLLPHAGSQTTGLEGVWQAKRDFGPVGGKMDIMLVNDK